MQMLLTFISSHLLTILESLLIKEEPQIVAQTQKEAQLLILKIESLLKSRYPTMEKVLDPMLNNANTINNDVIESIGNVVVQDVTKAS